MSEPAPALKPSAAIGRAERRLWLLEMMLGFCAALLRVVKPGDASAAFLQWARDLAWAAITRATGLAQRLKTETELELCVLRARPARPAAAAPPAARHERAEAPDREPRAPRQVREVGQTTGDDAAFRARIEALEAFLDRQADGLGAGLPPLQVAFRLCEALGLNPDWSRWLEDDWLAANLDLSRLPLTPAPLQIPPPPPRGPPAPAGQERIGPQPPPPAKPPYPEFLKTYVPGFKEALGRRVFEAIEVADSTKREFASHCAILEQSLATNQPYMWGCGRVPLRLAVQHLLDRLRIIPDWKRWRDDGWIKDGHTPLGDIEVRIRAAGVDLGEPGVYQPPSLPR